ncbi:major facilitator superfamily domain-containing protein [Delphinella strobiligena]|nr:major facilitator superfamily domain-containing protein [Delphinella strobiligena]
MKFLSRSTTTPAAATTSPAATTEGSLANVDNDATHDVTGPEKAKKHSLNLKFVLLMNAVFLVVFLVSLDRTIISTAIPKITNDFKSFNDVGWYGSSYLLTCCALQLLFGKLYSLWPLKWVLISSVIIFEVASVVAGAAPNSVAFIIGRAISGIGAAGIFAGVITTLVHVVPLDKRPKLQGLMGMFMSVATITGPLIGGGFTSNVTWRWCFYINLPIGGLALVAIYFFLNIPEQEETKQPLKSKLKQLDAPGLILSVPGIVALVLALQWGGQTYAWGSERVVALLVVAGVLLLAFGAVQVWLPATATLPPRIFKSRSVTAALWNTLCINCGNYVFVYFLPIWFQAIEGVTPVESGIRTLPLVIATVVGQLSGGLSSAKIGYYTQWAIAGTCFMSIGAGLLTTLEVNTSEVKWIGYQIIYGIGYGWTAQVPNLAMMTSLPKKDIPMGFALNLFVSLLGATVFVAVAENVLENQLLQRLSGMPGFNRSLITSSGATSLLNSFPANLRPAAVSAYNESLRKVFIVGLIPCCLGVLGAVLLEWKSVKKVKAAQEAEEKAAAELKEAEERGRMGDKTGA